MVEVLRSEFERLADILEFQLGIFAAQVIQFG